MTAPSLKLTYQDYLLLPEDNNRYEIIDGELYMTPSPTTRHQKASQNLFLLLHNFVKSKNLGEIFYAPTDVILSPTDVVVPDLLFVSRARAHIITEKNIQGAPDLIVEILSPGTAERDRELKKKLYAKHGVTEYWLVDPAERSLEIFRLTPEQATLHVSARHEGELTSPTFPGLTISLARVFE